ENTVILLSEVQRDVTGQLFYSSQVGRTLAPSANVPLYVLGGGAIGGGALGGAGVDATKNGAKAGEIAMQVPDGIPPDELPIQIQATGTPIVDWHAIHRWKINSSRLPLNCVVRNRPESLWAEHKKLIIAALVVFFAQALTIAGLLAQRAHRRRAEAEIQAQRTE